MKIRLKGRVKIHKVQVNLANTAPVDGRTDVQAFISAWKAAQGLFKNREHLCHGVTVDATDTLQWLDCIATLEGGVEKPFEARLKSRISGKLTPSGSQIVLTFHCTDPAELDNTVIERFLQSLYLAMNLSVPGSCNLHRASFLARRSPEKRIGLRTQREVWIDLSAEQLEFAYQSALKRGWPPFQRVELAGAWEWLERNGTLGLDVAREPWHRALFTILRVGSQQSHGSDVILLCVQAIEALLGQGAPASVVKRRVESVLGIPRTHKNWYRVLHDTRSRIVHGAAPIVRPGEWLNEDEASGEIAKYFEQSDLAYAVLLGLIQKLILKTAHTFQINEIVTLC